MHTRCLHRHLRFEFCRNGIVVHVDEPDMYRRRNAKALTDNTGAQQNQEGRVLFQDRATLLPELSTDFPALRSVVQDARPYHLAVLDRDNRQSHVRTYLCYFKVMKQPQLAWHEETICERSSRKSGAISVTLVLSNEHVTATADNPFVT